MLRCCNAKQSKLLHLDENQATQYRLATTTELVGKTIYLDLHHTLLEYKHVPYYIYQLLSIPAVCRPL